MLLSITTLRKGGTAITLERRGAKQVYFFTGPKSGPHVAFVDDEDDRKAFLAMGFGIHEGEKPEMSAEDKAAAHATLAEHYAILRKQEARAALLGRIAAEDAITPLTAMQQAQIDEIRAIEEPPLSLGQARSIYRAKMGKLPGPKWDVDKILAVMNGALEDNDE